MKRFIKISLVLTMVFAILSNTYSEREKVPVGSSFKSTSFKADAKGCPPSAANMYLDINNVRALIYTGGDMWHDFSTNRAAYYVPANSNQTSLYAGALWIGGVDVNDQLKLAAQQFRQGPDFKGGVDYWTGPLNITTANIDPDVCAQYDRFFVVSRAEIDDFIAWSNSENPDIEFPNYQIPIGIKEWPAHGDLSKGQSFYLAPFKDVDGDGIYDYNKGDYPYYDVTNELCPKGKGKDYTPEPTLETTYGIVKGGRLVDQVIKGDKTLWWVFNDKGNIHTESKGDPIGLEIRAQAFAFSTNDDINNMTFYSYEIINRSTYRLKDTYFGPWFDPDLGFADDDYVGCDVARGMGYCYNGKPIDGSGQLWAYGAQPPAVGIDFFQGPYLDPDGVDNPKWNYVTTPDGKVIDSLQVCDESINGVNFGNGIVDDERFGMRRFVYYDNGNDTRRGGPKEAQHYYNYLRGIWLDNAKLSYGGNGHPSDASCVGPDCNFMFPGDSDPCNWGTGGLPPNDGYNVNGKYWTEETAPNAPADRRFIQSAGPFTLEPGACNYITIGIPWARANAGGPWASVELLRTVDDKCQDLFDNCFKVLDGPAAPDMTFIENNRQLIVLLSNGNSKNDSNNYNEEYVEVDPSIKTPAGYKGVGKFDSVYKFQGYQIYQLKNQNVSVDQLYDTDAARIVAQFDIKDGVSRIVNYTWNSDLGANVPMLMVNGNDNGIQHSFVISNDAFSTTNDNGIVNYRQYYYMAVAYAYNSSPVYSDQNLDGIKSPFLLGRKNIKMYTAIPHPVGNGVVMNSKYGDKVTVTRLDGHGNGGSELELSKSSIEKILSKNPYDPDKAFSNTDYYPAVLSGLEYAKGKGPIDVKVIDPLKLKEGDFFLKFVDAKQKVVMKHYDSIRDGKPVNTQSVYKSHVMLEIESSSWIIYSDDYVNPDGSPLEPIESEQLLSIGSSNEQLILNLGISVNIKQVYNTGDIVAENRGKLEKSGVISSVMTYADSSKMWLAGIPDVSIPESSQNWIRSGMYIGATVDNKYNDFNAVSNPTGSSLVSEKGDTIWTLISTFWDKDGNFGKLAGGIIAPYTMCAWIEQNPMGPVLYKVTKTGATDKAGGASRENKPEWFDWGYQNNRRAGNVEYISSIDLVVTPDKSKWTRSVVLEMCGDSLLSENRAAQFSPRKAKSVDKNGKTSTSTDVSSNPEDPNYISATGMGWFPGYAINLETGERLNIMYGENSFLISDNGRDMQWNPSKNMYSNAPDLNSVFGGQHYVYVMGHRTVDCRTLKDFVADSLYMPPYDACKAIRSYFDVWNAMPATSPQTRDQKSNYQRTIMFGSMYVYMPLWNSQYKWLDNEATIKVRVTKPFSRYYSLDAHSLPFTDQSLYPNDGFPMYKFSTKGMAASKSDVAVFEDDMNDIRVVPNPYNAYSSYETNPIDTRVKIINLPDDCLVSIYNVAGTLVKQYQFVGTTIDGKQTTYLEWNLKNFAEIPIAGGLYYIHVKAKDQDGNTKEKVVKWFGSLRIPDVNTF